MIGYGKEEILSLIKSKNNLPFDLENGPLFRIFHFSRSTDGDIIVLSIHHIITDGTSAILLMETLLNTYIDFCKGRKPSFNDSKVSFKDYVMWEKEMLSGPAGKEHLEYWKKQLEGDLPVLNLPMDHPRPAEISFHGAMLKTNVPLDRTEKIKVFSNASRINPSVLFLGVLKVLLNRYTNEKDIVIGLPSMGRPDPRFEKVMGYFINMIPVRSQISGKMPFDVFAKNLRTTLFEGLSHAAYPLPVLVQELKLHRQNSLANLFQITYSYQNYVQHFVFEDQKDSSDHDLKIELLDEIHQEGEDELAFDAFEENQQFVFHLKYNPDLFNQDTMQRMMDHYLCLLDSVISNPSSPIAQLAMVSEKRTGTNSSALESITGKICYG